MRRPVTRTSRGGSFHVLLLLCSFTLVGYAGVRLLAGQPLAVVAWFVGAALVHDLVLSPLYAGADRLVTRGLGAVGRREWTVFVRVPAAFSGLLLLVWFPLVSGRVAERYNAATTLPGDRFLSRWLVITAALFGGSAVTLVLRSVRSRRRPGHCAGRVTKLAASRRSPRSSLSSLSSRLRRATKWRPPDVH